MECIRVAYGGEPSNFEGMWRYHMSRKANIYSAGECHSDEKLDAK
jgi:hypothetical protein